MRSTCVFAMALLLAACGSGPPTPTATAHPSAASETTSPALPSGVAGCVPECLAPGGISPGHVPPGPYTTRFFFGGALTVTLGTDWNGRDDTTTELIFEHLSSPNWLLGMWVDPHPIEHLAPVAGMFDTSDKWVAWLQANPTLIATPGPMVMVWDTNSATTVDLEVSDQATMEFSDCPDLCTNFLGFDTGTDTYGLVRGEKTRFYLASVTYGGQVHLLILSVEVVDGTEFDAVLPTAEELLRTIRMPVAPAG
jgi:hypothetical protein